MIAYYLPIFLILIGIFQIYIQKKTFLGKISLFIGVLVGIACFIIIHIKGSEINTRKYVSLKAMAKEYPEINKELKLFYSDKKITNEEYLKIVLIVEKKRKDFLEDLSK